MYSRRSCRQITKSYLRRSPWSAKSKTLFSADNDTVSPDDVNNHRDFFIQKANFRMGYS